MPGGCLRRQAAGALRCSANWLAHSLPFVLALILAIAAGSSSSFRTGAAIACLGLIPGCAACPLLRGNTYICPICSDSRLYSLSSDGTRCDCKPGAYANCSNALAGCQCQPCLANSYCNGGRNEAGQAIATPCAPGLVTRPGVVANRRSQCVLDAGWGWTLQATVAPVQCQIGSYSTGGYASIVPCMNCPSGLTTNHTGATSKNDCMAGPGRYFDGGEGKPCPAGTFQPGFTLEGISTCRACSLGVTTAGAASSAASNCSVALPGWGITCNSSCSDGATAAQCTLGYYNEGGQSSSSCKACPWGLTTQFNASSSDSDCCVPPGFGLLLPLPANNTQDSRMVDCASVNGYNPGWNRQPCTSCGVNVTSFAPAINASSCYVLQGQGLQVVSHADTAAPQYRVATDCGLGSIGMPSNTPVALARPCNTCPRGMITLGVRSYSPSQCLAPPGYTNATGELGNVYAAPCGYGWFKGVAANIPCTACMGNTTTLTTTAVSLDNCSGCLPGFGNWTVVDGSPQCSLCEPGTYSPGGLSQCMPCTSGTVSGPGEVSCVAPPTASTCTARPAANTFDVSYWRCPQSHGQYGDVPGGNTASLPPRCHSGKNQHANTDCSGSKWGKTPVGRLILGPMDGPYETCMCPNAETHGDVILYDATTDEYYCAPLAQFLPDSPGSSTGIWVPALDASEQACNSSQTCYDMCFYCDGSPRYQSTVPSATRSGLRQYRANNGTCGGSWCRLGDHQTASVPFEQACREYVDKAGPADYPNISGTWPFRPVLSVPYIIQISPAGMDASESRSIRGLYDTAFVLQGFQ